MAYLRLSVKNELSNSPSFNPTKVGANEFGALEAAVTAFDSGERVLQPTESMTLDLSQYTSISTLVVKNTTPGVNDSDSFLNVAYDTLAGDSNTLQVFQGETTVVTGLDPATNVVISLDASAPTTKILFFLAGVADQ